MGEKRKIKVFPCDIATVRIWNPFFVIEESIEA
jgi:hypothetical protein